jgi:response regulator RpfG family c-di-GMP phosphodiesterase
MSEVRVPDKILLVDDDPNILSGYQRQLRKAFNVETALGGAQALETIGDRGPFAVVVSDLKMPGMSGVELLGRVKAAAPDTVRLMLTGFADVDNAIAAVNEGNIVRFLTKPCAMETLARALVDGIKQYRLVTAERELLEKTLAGSIKVLSDILALLNPPAWGRSSRLQRLAADLGRQMGFSDLWSLETAALLSQIGMVLLPPETLEKILKGKDLSGEERQVFDMHPFVAADLLKDIPRLEAVAQMVAYQEQRFDGSGVSQEARAGENIPLGARILKVALDYDLLTLRNLAPAKALAALSQRGGYYDPAVLAALKGVLFGAPTPAAREMNVGVKELTETMVFLQDVMTKEGAVVVPKGYRVTRLVVKLLQNFEKTVGLRLPLPVCNQPEDEPPGLAAKARGHASADPA